MSRGSESVSGKTALVTGVSRGIGHEIAGMLLYRGWQVVGISRTGCDDLPGLASHMLDLSLPHQVERLSWLLPDRLDAVVHCAAIQGPVGPLWEVDARAWLDTIRVNLIGSYLVTRACLPKLESAGDGRILLFSGGGAFGPRHDYSAYAASKAGVVALMETLSDELRDARSGVTVNCVAPGFVKTGIDPRTVLLPGERNGSKAMSDVLACVWHLLSPLTAGLTGRTVSAPWDDWRSITSVSRVASINASGLGRRTRTSISMVSALGL